MSELSSASHIARELHRATRSICGNSQQDHRAILWRNLRGSIDKFFDTY